MKRKLRLEVPKFAKNPAMHSSSSNVNAQLFSNL